MADIIKYAFVAGEISPTLFGRTDLEKYDLALALARNWFVDYRGGLSTRPGTRFIDVVQYDDLDTKFIPFKFAPNTSSTYVILFGYGYIRFIQDGAYILEAAKAISGGVTSASPGVVTAAAHGYNDGDLVKIFDVVGMTDLNGQTFVVAGKTANTFQLKDVWGQNVNTAAYSAYVSGGSVYRVYTVSSPYTTTDLELLRGHQSRSTIELTHSSYAPRVLTRISDTNWTLALDTFGATLAPPSGLAITPSTAGTAGVGFCVTSIDSQGNESIASVYKFSEVIVEYVTVAGSVKFTWSPVSGAVAYNVYRTNVLPVGTEVTRAMQVGYIGTAFGPELVDNNIIPDFTTTPPIHSNPFASGAVEYIAVTAGGAGYTKASTVSVSGGGGSGFVGYPVVNAAGVLLAIVIENGGAGYSGATATVTVGAGATTVVHLTDATGNNPRVSNIFQQRKVFAATENDPLTVWGSRPGQFSNMDISEITQDDDSYEFEIDSEEVAPILHMLATRSGLVLLSQSGIWQLSGGNGVAVTPTNALADPQSYTGCSLVPPIPVDTDIIYVEGKGATVRLLSYNDYSKVFASQDLSILSNHLTDPLKPIKVWGFASDPFKLVQAVRSDGIMLMLTLVKEQNVFGWTTAQTRGLFKDVLSIQQDRTDVVYTMVQRLIGGRYVKYIEQFARRDFIEVEDAWCVDCGLSNDYAYPAAILTAAAATGTGIVFSASAAVFSSGDVGKIIRGGGCKAIITAYTNTTHVTCTIIRDITAVLPEDEANTPLPILSGAWTMDAPITVIRGLWHLEGQLVSILADGNVMPQQTVANGRITLPTAATRVIVGMGYQCLMQTLPPTTTDGVIESKKKRIVGIQARVYQTRGLKAGQDLDKPNRMYPFKERTDEAYGEPTRLQGGVKPLTVSTSYNREAQLYIVQDDPLPATVLGYITELDVGE